MEPASLVRFCQYQAAKIYAATLANHSLDISRDNMPQIKVDKNFEEFLIVRKIKFEKTTEIPFIIKPTQNEFNIDKIVALMQPLGFDSPILISKDNYCIDGHHRYIAACVLHIPLWIMRIDLPIQDCLDLMKEYDGVTFKGVNEGKK